MIVGVPKEVKNLENRVSLTPAGVVEYRSHGHRVLVQRQAGAGSGISDDDYAVVGAEMVDGPEMVYGPAEMIVKVKEPVPSEFDMLRRDQILFTYLHLAANEPLTRCLMERGVQAIAYETVQLPNGHLPLLTPMSEVAGRMSAQVGAHYLEKPAGGRGMLLGGVPGVAPASVVIIGGGVVGTNAARIALGMGASVTIIDKAIDRLDQLDLELRGRLQTLAANRHTIAEAVREADVVIGAVLIPGAKAPKLVTAEMVRSMRPGSVVVDVAIDQGGCIETARPTTHSDPVYEVDGVTHYCVTNMPGAVPRTSTFVLANATLPYGVELANEGLAALTSDSALAQGANIINGEITYRAVANAFGLPYTPLAEALGH